MTVKSRSCRHPRPAILARRNLAAGTDVRNRVVWICLCNASGQDRDPRRAAAQPQKRRPDLPRDKLVVITGLSGSGQVVACLRHDLRRRPAALCRELSSYARQFLGQMDKPDVEYISGLSPAISIDQKGASHNPRSTVGTVTEIYDYLRLLFARIGHPHCPKCHRPIQQQTLRADHRRRPGHARGRAHHGPGAAGRSAARASSSPCSTTFAKPVLSACAWTARSETCQREDRARKAEEAFDRRGRRSAGGLARVRGQVAHRRLRRAGAEARLGQVIISQPTADRRSGTTDAVLGEFRLPVRRHVAAGARAAQFFVQHAARRVSDLHRPGHPARGRPRPDPGQQGPEPGPGRDRGVGQSGWNGNSYYKSLLESVAKHYGFSMNTPIRDLKPEHLQTDPVWLGHRADRAHLPEQERPQPRVPRALRRHHSQHRAALQRDRERVRQGRPAEVHGARGRVRRAKARG